MNSVKTSTSEQFFNILILQAVSAVIFIALAACIRIFGGQMYNEMSEKYHSAFDDTTNIGEVLNDDGSNAVTDAEDAKEANADVADVSSPSEEDSFDNCNYIIDFSIIRDNMSLSKRNNISLEWPLVGEITSRYGYRTNPITNKYAMHGGIDIAVNTGERVSAAMSGTVSEQGYSSSYGYYVILDHGNNMQTVYAHCKKISVKEGDFVHQGDKIAESGNTGNSTGPHLHFEVRLGGSRVDPEWMLGQMASV